MLRDHKYLGLVGMCLRSESRKVSGGTQSSPLRMPLPSGRILRPIREEASRLMKDKAYLESVYKAGAEKASYVAEKTLRKVYKKVGFVAR